MNKKIKIEIKSFGGKVLFQYDSTINNLKKTVEKAVEQGAVLREMENLELKKVVR